MIDDDEVLSWVRAAAGAADAKGHGEVVVLAVGELLAVTSYFVIGSGRNDRQVKAMAGAVEEAVLAAGGPKPVTIEGLDTLQWVLVNYGDFVVHLFVDEARAFYELERLWRDVPTVDWRGEGGADAAAWS